MKVNKVLIITAIAGLFFSGCAEFQLPKVQKKEQKESCAEIIKKYKKLRSQGYIGNEPDLVRTLGKNYAVEASYCETEDKGADIDIEKIMDKNR